MRLCLFQGRFVASSKEIEDGVVIDFDKEGQLIGSKY